MDQLSKISAPLRAALVLALFSLLASKSVMAESPHTGFNHRLHQQKWPSQKPFSKACSSCHPEGEKSNTVRPGQANHSACDSCHKDLFYNLGTNPDASINAPTRKQLCTVCHETDRYGEVNPLHPFPYMTKEEHVRGRDISRDTKDFFVTMSHKNHVRYYSRGVTRPKARCNNCHQVQKSANPVSMPTHQECVYCHRADQEDSPKRTFSMSACGKCHKFQYSDIHNKKRQASAPARRNRKGRVTSKFSHWNHRYQRLRGKAKRKVSCEVCHAHVKNARTLRQVVPIKDGNKTMIDGCGTCHRRNMKSAKGKMLVRITGDCGFCHTKGSLLGTDVPESHRGAP